MSTGDCPSDEALAGYAGGECAKEEATAVRAHVENCRRCSDWLADAEANEAILPSVIDIMTDPASGLGNRMPAAPTPLEPPSGHERRESATAFPAIEGYEILREVHRGGQGVIYQASQESTKRKVAIKVLLEGPYASRSARQRFEREIELVASLKHPNIVSVFHSGRTSDGHQYCVMDYVRGVPLGQYARDKNLPLEDILKLFGAVCEAVNYAHQKGVIHRDLKPSNILVDGEGNPKVLDFGLARLVGGPERTVVSITGQVMGTLPYMSPEQARGNPDEIDIRTDVYALGVVLYELLTGRYPYPVIGQMADVLRHIAETPPTPPSRQWTSDSGVTQRAGRRIRMGECPIDGEVQTIILKALSKERERRYQSGGELARDIRHYLAHEPLEGRRDSAFYVLSKALRRHRVAVGTTAVFGLLLLGALGVTTTLWRTATTNKAKAERTLNVANELWEVWTEPLPAADAAVVLKAAGEAHRVLDEYAEDTELGPWVQDRRDQVDGLLREALDRILETNRLHSVLTVLRQQPELLLALQRLGGSSGTEESYLGRLQDRLESWLQFPFPVDRGQEMLDGLNVLKLIDPGNARARRIRDQWDSLTERMPAVYEQDLSGYTEGETPDPKDGKATGPGCTIEVRRSSTGPMALMVAANPSNTGSVRFPLETDDAVVAVKCRLEFPKEVPQSMHLFQQGTLALYTNSRVTTCMVRFDYGSILAEFRGERGGRRRTAPRRISRGQPHNIELRYFTERCTFDVLVDGEFLVEEAPCLSPGEEIAHLYLSIPEGNNRVYVRDLVIRSTDEPLKATLGDRIPMVKPMGVCFRPIRHLPLVSHSIFVSDINGDGVSELVAGEESKPGTLSFFRFAGQNLNEELISEDVSVGGELRLYPAGLVDGRLAVFNIAGVGREAANDNYIEMLLQLLDVDEDLSVDSAFSTRYLIGATSRCIAPIQYTADRRGFVVGHRDPGRCLAFFENAPTGFSQPYMELGACNIPYKLDTDEYGDVVSVAPCDWDDDPGDDVLFIGWGQRKGNCPALVVLPENIEAEELLVAQPLTEEPVGETQVVLSNLGTGAPYLIAASQNTIVDNGPVPGGLRVWRVADLKQNVMAKPLWEEPLWEEPLWDVRAITTGVIAKREVLATVSIEPTEADGSANSVFRIHGFADGTLELLWEATLYAGPPNDGWVQLVFADIDDDGEQELIANSGSEQGVYIFGRRDDIWPN